MPVTSLDAPPEVSAVPVPGLAATVSERSVRVEFRSPAEFRECEQRDLARGRLFVPGACPVAHGGSIRLELVVPGLPVLELRSTLVIAFGQDDAARLGVAPGFVLAFTWPARGGTGPAVPRVSDAPVHVSRRARAPRYRKRLPVTFAPLAAKQLGGFTTNLSATGLSISTAHVQQAGTKLVLHVTTPDSPRPDIQGVVVWAFRGMNGANGSMGVRLVSANEEYFRLLLSIAPPHAPDSVAASVLSQARIVNSPEPRAVAPSAAESSMGSPSQETVPAAPMETAASSAPSVLIVEDDLGTLEALRDTLCEEGFVVLTATDGIEATRVIERFGPPSAVIVDLMMPVMNGWEFVSYLRVNQSSVPVIVVSAHGSPPRTEAYLPKPYDLVELVGTLNRLSGRGELR